MNENPQVFLTVLPYLSMVGAYGSAPVLQSRPDDKGDCVDRVNFSVVIHVRCGPEHLEDVLELFVVSPNGKACPLHKVEMMEICKLNPLIQYRDVDQWSNRGTAMINFSDVPVLGPGQYFIKCKTQRDGILDRAYFVVK